MTAPETMRRPGRLKMIEARPQILGHVVIGEPGEKFPRKFDHLEIRRPSRDGNDRLELDLPMTMALAGLPSSATCGGCERCKEIEQLHGVRLPKGLPRRIGIYLPSDDLDVIFPTGLAFYRGRRRFCHGDGATALRHEEGTGKDGHPVFGPLRPYGPCGEGCEDFRSRRCRPSAHLNFVLANQHVAGGFFQFRTSSWASIRAIEAGLAQIREVAGTVRFVGLVFEIAQKRVQPADGSKAGKAWIAHLYYPGSYAQLAIEARQELAAVAPQRTAIRALEAELRTDTLDPLPAAQAAFADEFHSAAVVDEVSQEIVDPMTGEVLEDVPTIDRSASGSGDLAVEAPSPGPAPAGEEGDGGPFGATSDELAAEAARSDVVTEAQLAHLARAFDRSDFATVPKRRTFLRRLTRRNVDDVADLSLEEYGQACLELGIPAAPPSAEGF